MAKECGESHISEQCLCNAGIATGNQVMEDKSKMFKTFYGSMRSEPGSTHFSVGGGIHAENWSDEDEEDDEEAEYGGEGR